MDKNKYKVVKTVRLKEHNSKNQLGYGGHGFSDTKDDLEVGKWYDVAVEVHGWHTRYYIGEKYYNSVCFDDINSTLIADLKDKNKRLRERIVLLETNVAVVRSSGQSRAKAKRRRRNRI